MFGDRVVSFVGCLCLSWLCLGLALAAPALAGDDYVLVSRQDSSVSITVSDLLANDPEAVSLVSFVPAVRGALSLSGPDLIYLPGASFWTMGSDSFSYVYSTPKGNGTSVVYLIADLKEDLEFSDTVDDPLLPDWQEVDPQSRLAVAVEPVTQNQAVLVTYGAGATAYIEYQIVGRAPTVTGGNTDFVIDPGADGIGPPVTGSNPFVTGASIGGTDDEWVYEMVIASGFTQGGDPAYEIVVQEADSGTYLLMRARRELTIANNGTNSEWVSTAPVEIGSKRARVSLTWWSAAEGEDGGAMLAADGKLIGWISGIDNSGYLADIWRFGSLTSPSGAAGQYYFDEFEFWSATDPPAFTPLLADGFESAGLSLWSLVSVNAALPSVTPAAALSGGYGLEVAMPASGSSYVGEPANTALNALRVRFKLRLSADFAMVDLKSVDLFNGRRGANVQDPVRLRLRQLGSQLKLKAMARKNGGGWVSTPWTVVPTEQVVEVELHWWSAQPQTAMNGGVELWVDGALSSKRQLDNGGIDLDELHFGLNVVPTGSVGTLYLDEIEGWR